MGNKIKLAYFYRKSPNQKKSNKNMKKKQNLNAIEWI